MTHASDWAEMATAVWTYVERWGDHAVPNVLSALEGYVMTKTSSSCDDAPEPLSEPWPSLSGPQRAAMVVLSAGPRLTPEVADTCGWSRGTAGSVLSALRRRGLAVEVGGLWSRA